MKVACTLLQTIIVGGKLPLNLICFLAFSFGRSLVIGIGVILLVLMCIGLSGFCCPIPRRTNIFSTVGRPPTGVLMQQHIYPRVT